MSNKFKAEYDSENDVLFIHHSEKKSRGSIEIGPYVHISFSPSYDAIGLEFLDASKTLTSLSVPKFNFTKNFLKTLQKAFLETKVEKGLLIVRYYMFFEEKEKPLVNQLIVQSIGYRSPITATA